MSAKWFIPALALSALLFASPVWAAAIPEANVSEQQAQTPGDAKQEHHHGHMTRKDFEAHRLERLKEMAQYFGIDTSGKTAQQLKQELEVAKTSNKDKWEAYKAEHKARRLEHLRDIAAKHGIKTDGKSEEQLREELYKLHGGRSRGHGEQPSGGWHIHEQDGEQELEQKQQQVEEAK
ncbi:hypothetical protein [Paenibacillus sp. 2TAB19]|uniref:hypothetical protein n=1 Tax=Paenibacillus sp. 2TAB19 TaxID=3233003 RepID=UPI003F9B9A58